jgi:uncharacterized protein (TIGR03437 family)
MRRLLLLVLVASTLPAQYYDFAVTDDGRLYFATPLSAGTEDSRLKIYRLTGGVLELFAKGGEGEDPFGPTASAPLVSGDGSITGWALDYQCRSGSCGLSGLPRIFYQLQGVTLANLTYNNLQISRNGRYLASVSFDGRLGLIELPSQGTTEIGRYLLLAGPQSVADNGAVLMRDAGTNPVLLYRPRDSDAAPVPGSDGVIAAVLSPAGDRIAYERRRGDRYELALTNPRGSTHSVLAATPLDMEAPWPNFRFQYQPRFANDGTLLYIDSEGQPAIAAPGQEPRRLATIEGGVQRAIISGDGQVAWLASFLGQLLRVRTRDGAVEEIVPATPYLMPSSVVALPGSVIRLSGSGITAATRFQIGDMELPFSEFGRQSMAAQIPWEYSPGQGGGFVTVQGAGSPLRQRIEFVPLGRPTITFERDVLTQALQLAHQDFRGVLSEADPARPGETIHAFARNMGPVDRPVATGERSPDAPPAQVTTPFACYLFELQPDGTPLRPQGVAVPFAGLSAGLIGIYQIDVTVPADWKSSRALLQCQMDTGDNIFRGDAARIDVGAGVDAGAR